MVSERREEGGRLISGWRHHEIVPPWFSQKREKRSQRFWKFMWVGWMKGRELTMQLLRKSLQKEVSVGIGLADAFPKETIWLRDWPHSPSAINIYASENPDRIPAQSPWVATKELPWVSFPPNIFNRNAVAAVHLLIADHIGRNAVGVVFVLNRLPKVGACAPTLGYGTQSRWDCFLQTFLSGLGRIWGVLTQGNSFLATLDAGIPLGFRHEISRHAVRVGRRRIICCRA